MYICICNAVTDHRIRDAIDAGADTFEALQNELHVATCCGSCECEVREILAEQLAETSRSPCLHLVGAEPGTAIERIRHLR